MNQTNDLDIQTAFVGAVIVASSISIIIIQLINKYIYLKHKFHQKQKNKIKESIYPFLTNYISYFLTKLNLLV